jgi:hypothetical protein
MGLWDKLQDGEVDLEDQDDFIEALKETGFTEREAFAHWFSP